MPKQDPCETGVTKRSFLKLGVGGACAFCLARLPGVSSGLQSAQAQTAQKGLIKTTRSPWSKSLEAQRLQCTLCPKACELAPDERGICRVRENRGGDCYSLVHGNPCLIQMDPIERKPFFHVLPGSRSLSVSTAGCNIECKFCEVWDMALVYPEDVYAYDMPPATIIAQAKENQARSVSYTFGEPIAFYEYMADMGALAKESGLLSLMHSSGYINKAPLEKLCEAIDGVNIDLKGFTDDFYRDVCDGELAPVLDSLQLLKKAGIHIEITNIVIPTLNDDVAVIREMCSWIKTELGAETPIHFARFYPLYKLANLPPTPVSTLDAAREAAFDTGLEYVYIANVTDHEGENTFCPKCGKKVIARMGFMVEEMHIQDGKCAQCGHAIPGIWSSPE